MADERISDQLSDYFARIGRKGGYARAKAMTPEQRKAGATKASRAAAKVRTSRAKRKRRKET